MPIDYSRWKDIEVSDDEDDIHPNVDTPSLFRWRHQARVEKMADEKRERQEIDLGKAECSRKIKDLTMQLESASIDQKEKNRLKILIDEQEKSQTEWLQREKDFEHKIEMKSWNVDTIGKETWSKTRINKASDSNGPPKPSPEDDTKLMMAFFEQNKSLIKQYGRLRDFQESEKFLMEHPHMCSEYTANYLTIDALNAGIEDKDSVLARVAHQVITMQYLLELAKSLKAKPDTPSLIQGFFRKISAAEQSYMKMYNDEVQAFMDRVHRRAKQKIEEAHDEIREKEEAERLERIAQSPGGLDPIEVMQSLPEVMQKAFESQDVEELKKVAAGMDEKVFHDHLQRCIASGLGLWLPNGALGAAEQSHGDETPEDENAETYAKVS